MKKETLKECGKAVLNLANIIGGLSVINSVFTTVSLSIPTIMIIIYTFVILYSGGLILIEKGEKMIEPIYVAWAVVATLILIFALVIKPTDKHIQHDK